MPVAIINRHQSVKPFPCARFGIACSYFDNVVQNRFYSDCEAFIFGGGSPGLGAELGAVVPVAGEGIAWFVGAPSAPPVRVFPFVLLPPDTDEGIPVLLEVPGVA